MTKTFLLAAALLAAALATPAQAALTPIRLSEGKDWQHPETGLVVPAKVAGFVRTSGGDFGNSGSDIVFQYEDESGATRVTLYYFRAGVPDVSIWTDRVDRAMQSNTETFGKFDTSARLWSIFTPTTGGASSGIRLTYPVSGGRIKATGAAMEQRGKWLVAVRVSSETLDAKALDQTIAELMKALAYSPEGQVPAAAYAMAPCADALSGKRAKPAKEDKEGGFMGAALMNSIAPDVAEDEAAKGNRPAPVTYCRDPGSQAGYGIYRAGGTRDSYLIAIGDAGVVLQVGPDLSGLLADDKTQQFSVTAITNDRMFGFVPYQGLPSPDQALETIQKGRVIYSRSRVPGHEKEIQISM